MSEPIELLDDAGRSRGYYSPRNRLNDLTGKEWIFATRSVITKPYPPNLAHDLRSQHGGQKPPELCRDLICTFTKRGERVLDPLAGVGGTLLGASLCERQAYGIEIEPHWVDIYQEVCRLTHLAPQEMIIGDALILLQELGEDSFDFVLTDVPYWHMDKVAKSPGKFKRVGEPTRPKTKTALRRFNSFPIQGKAEWLRQMQEIFDLCRARVRPGRYIATFVGDMYHAGRYHPLSFELAEAIEETGLVLKASLIWYDVSKKLHVYGYRYAFIPSMVHQNILIFRRED